MLKLKVYAILRTWVIVFALWFSWESVILVYANHFDWNLKSSLTFVLLNLGYGICWSLILGTIYGFLTKLIRHAWISSAGIAVAAVVSVPIILYYRTFVIQHQLPVYFRWLSAAALILAIFAAIALAARVLRPIVLKHRTLFACTLAALFLVPFGFFILHPFLQKKVDDFAQGPIRRIVLISVDTLRYDYVGAYKVNKVSTPVMDRIAEEGALFKQAISHIPHTGPSHTSMFTGKAPLSHGIRFNGQPLPSKNAPVTLTQRLHKAGFKTGGFVSGIPMKSLYSGLNRGFEAYDDSLAWNDMFTETSFGLLWSTIPFRTRCLRRTASEVAEPALKWLSHNMHDSFFLFLHFYDPHYPYGTKAASDPVNPWKITATPEDVESQKRLYAQQVEKVDFQIGRIVELLKENKIYDETLLIITSDHGESLGEHNYYYSHDHVLYEELLRVPLLIRCPVLLKSGTVVENQVALLDIYRTILDAAGLKPDPGTVGQSLIGIAAVPGEPGKTGIPWHNFVSEVHSIRTDSFKLIRNDKKPDRLYEFYDLANDPFESMNLYSENSQQAQLIKKLMTQQFVLIQKGPNWKPEDLTPEQIEDLRSLGYFN